MKDTKERDRLRQEIEKLSDKQEAYEYCPKCDAEVLINGKYLSHCPSCGRIILPCSMCSPLKPQDCGKSCPHRGKWARERSAKNLSESKAKYRMLKTILKSMESIDKDAFHDCETCEETVRALQSGDIDFNKQVVVMDVGIDYKGGQDNYTSAWVHFNIRPK